MAFWPSLDVLIPKIHMTFVDSGEAVEEAGASNFFAIFLSIRLLPRRSIQGPSCPV
jgi:hypothetical protein